MKVKHCIVLGALLTSCSQQKPEESNVLDNPLWAKSPFDTLSPEEKRAWKENRHERLAANEAFMVEEAARQKVKLQKYIEDLNWGAEVLYFNHKGLSEFVSKTVPKGSPGEGLKYYKDLRIKRQVDRYDIPVLEATLFLTDSNEIDHLCYDASIWNGEGEETHLHTWDLLQARIAHTKELMQYMMELAGDVDGEHIPSKFNYEVIVINDSMRIPKEGGKSDPYEYGRRIKRCSEFGLFHLPYLTGPNFSQYHSEMRKKTWDPYHKD